MSKEKFFNVLYWAFIAVPFIYLFMVWNQLPAQVATHFGANGNPDRYGPKSNIAMFLAFLLLPATLLILLPKLDPKRNFEHFKENYLGIRLIIAMFLGAIGCVMVYGAAHPLNVSLIICALISLLIAGIGNFIHTCKPNYFVGIRTPWTLESESVWRKTHRLGGSMMFWGGLLGFALSFVLPNTLRLPIVMGIIVATALVPAVYSYFIFRKEVEKV